MAYLSKFDPAYMSDVRKDRNQNLKHMITEGPLIHLNGTPLRGSVGNDNNQEPIHNTMDTRTLLSHVTTGGAVYVSDNHKFADASIVVRIDASTRNEQPEAIAAELVRRWNNHNDLLAALKDARNKVASAAAADAFKWTTDLLRITEHVRTQCAAIDAAIANATPTT